MKLELLRYSLSGITFMFAGLLLKEAFRKPSPREIMLGKVKPVSGRGSKAWYIYLGLMMFIFAIVVLTRFGR